MSLVFARGLPGDPIDAAADFAVRIVPAVRTAIQRREGPICLVFDPADYMHRGWRLAALQSLAREAAPSRINAIATPHDYACDAALTFFDAAPGVTGQYLELDGQGAGDPLA